MTADAILTRLNGVRRTSERRWTARCPAHDDKRPSLSIRELDDYRVLLHCHAGCDVQNVLQAVGLDFNALYPPRTDKPLLRPVRKPWRASDVVAALRGELNVVFVILSTVAAKTPVNDDDAERACIALGRIAHFLHELADAA